MPEIPNSGHIIGRTEPNGCANTGMGPLTVPQMQQLRDQAASVSGKDTPFRVEFHYRGGTKHWQYFVSEKDASEAKDSLCSYSPSARIERPFSQVLQVRGPRGGWRRG